MRANVGIRLPHWPDLNARALADHMGVNSTYLRCVLTGRRKASEEFVRRIANTLGVSAVELKATQRLAAKHYGPANGRGTIGRKIKKSKFKKEKEN